MTRRSSQGHIQAPVRQVEGIATGVFKPGLESPVLVPLFDDGQVDERGLLEELKRAGIVSHDLREISAVFQAAAGCTPDMMPDEGRFQPGASYFLVIAMDGYLPEVDVDDDRSDAELDQELMALTDLLEAEIQAGTYVVNALENYPANSAWIRVKRESDVEDLIADYLEAIADF